MNMPRHNYWPNRSFVAFDTETTGLDFENDRIIQAAIAVFVRGQQVWSFDWLLNTSVPSSPEALAVHKIDDQLRWDTGLDSKEVMLHLVAMFRRMTHYNSPIIAYNAPFDFTMLRKELTRFKISYDFKDLHVIDPLVIDRHFQKNVPIFTKPHMRQEQMAARYGILPPSHNALEDAICTGNIAVAQSLHHSGIRNVSPNELHRKQEVWFGQFKEKVNAFADKKQITFTLSSWPFGDD
jgi:DNA polymerase III subunit epsilon